jgi:hypothetical protein
MMLRHHAALALTLALGLVTLAPAARGAEAPSTGRQLPNDATAAPSRSGDDSSFRIAPFVLVPIGRFEKATGVGVGALVGFEYRAAKEVAFTGSVGYVAGLDRVAEAGPLRLSSSVSALPVLGGAKWSVQGAAPEGLYLAMQAGVFMLTANAQVSGGTGPLESANMRASNSTMRFGGGMFVGYQLGRFDLRAGALTLDFGSADASTSLALGASYSLVDF